MRDYLLETLPRARYHRFLVYVMGPYKAHGTPDEGTFDFLREFCDGLRMEGFNAFLAVDADVDLAETDAATQSLAFARASNAVLFVVRLQGKNLGVGIETGAVLEDQADRAPERVLLLHEEGVRSAMIASVADRWDAAVRTFADDEELLAAAKLFLLDVMNRELTGDLPTPGAE